MSFRKIISYTSLIVLILVGGFFGIRYQIKQSLYNDVNRYITTPSLKPTLQRTQAVRFDPSFYYTGKRPSELARELADRWHEAGINLVFFRAYDPSYGSFYRTEYLYNKEGEFGQYDLLKHILNSCEKKNIKVFAWLPVMNHQGAWEANPEWRKINQQGEEYTASGLEYPLCARNLEARSWWQGFIQDLLQNYPKLSGVDLAEPVVSWREGEACYCKTCREAEAEGASDPEEVRARPLTSLLHQSFKKVHQFNRKTSLTFVASAKENGDLFSFDEIRRQTGLDLTSLLNASSIMRPNFICPEFIWQEWKSRFHEEGLGFSPQWSASAFQEFVQNLDSPVKVIPHLEATDFPGVSVDPDQIAAMLQSILEAGARGFDIYSSSLLDKKHAWGVLEKVDQWFKVKSCLVLYDPTSNRNDAVQTGELLRHFNTRVELKSLDQYQPGLIKDYDNVFYVGGEADAVIPESLIKDIEKSLTTFCWLGFNVDQLLSHPSISKKLGIKFKQSVKDTFVKVKYKKKFLAKNEPWTQEVKITNPTRSVVLAKAYNEDQSKEIPYVVRSGRDFWLFADLPSAYAVEGGRFLVFADLLHDILNEDHVSGNQAMVRIEDVHPLTDPQSLKKIANFLHRRKVPFQVALCPFYVNPEENIHTSLSDHPELVSALKHMVRQGGVLVMHGVTHQRFLETTTDYEFWDPVNDAPVQGQTETTVHQRVERGLRECWINGLYPLVWETPHYAASQEFYSVISRIFSLAMERRQAINKRGTDQCLPYALLCDRYGQTLVPENLGYVPLENPDPRLILKPADHMKVVRDGVASFFFHPFVDIEALKTIVYSLQKSGFQFTSIASLPISVETSFGLTKSSSGLIKFTPEHRWGIQSKLFFPGILKSQKEFRTAPGEKIEKKISISPREMYVLHFFNPVEETVRKNVRKKDLKKDTALRMLRRVADFQGEEAEVPTALLLHTQEANNNQINEILSYEAVFKLLGISISRFPAQEFEMIPDEINLLIIPEASALQLQNTQIEYILDILEQGRISVITSGYSPLSDALGIEKTPRIIQVKEIQDLAYPGVKIMGSMPESLHVFEAPGDAVYIYQDLESGEPLMVSSSKGRGKFLYSGPLFDSKSSQGITRYPHFLTHVFQTFNLFPLLRGKGAEVFFNPVEREDTAAEDLIKFWRRSGVKIIHAAGWHVYPEWTYDYEQLISLAHNNSMLVYAWLEPPLVHEKFWLEHPEWREKNALGGNPEETWRHPMALGDPKARTEAIKEWKRILGAYPWDGVTVNRLGFEASFPPDPKIMTPFHSSVRLRFKVKNDFDPIELFNANSPFYWRKNTPALKKYMDFRRQLSEEYTDALLKMLEEFRKEQDRFIEIILTYDARRTDPGISVSKAQKINTEHNVLWQYIPEPEKAWINPSPPFDILQLTISPNQNGKGFIPEAPTSYPTGTALYQKLRELVRDSQRYIIYSENSLYEVDTQMLPFVMSSERSLLWGEDQLHIQSEKGGEVLFTGEKFKKLQMDGTFAGSFYNNRLLVPSGEHTLQIKSGSWGGLVPLKSKTRVVDFSGNLRKIDVKWRGVTVDYEADRGSYLVITDEPLKITQNGEKYGYFAHEGQRGWTIYTPPGSSNVEIITRGYSEVFLSVLSLSLSNLIVFVSAAAIFSLLVLFLFIQLRRFVQRKKE